MVIPIIRRKIDDNMKTYKIKSKYILSNSIYFIFPLLMTFAVVSDSDGIQVNEWIGISSFWFIGILVMVVFLFSKIEVGEDYIHPYFFGFSKRKIYRKDIEVIEYGNLFRGGLGVGKGLKMWIKKSDNSLTYRSIGEKAYGKEAIAHIRKVLE